LFVNFSWAYDVESFALMKGSYRNINVIIIMHDKYLKFMNYTSVNYTSRVHSKLAIKWYEEYNHKIKKLAIKVHR